jgi:hypothetical protein
MRKAAYALITILSWTFNTVAFVGLMTLVATGPSLWQ